MSKLGLTFTFLAPLFLLACLSLLIISSVAPSLFNQQLAFFAIAFALILILGRIDYQLYVFSAWPWYLMSLLLLISTLVLGQVIRGSARWLEIAGVSIQTSELVKPLLIIFVGAYLSRYLPQSVRSLIWFLVIMLAPTFLIFMQPDLGNAILILIITASAVIASGVGLKHIFLTTLLLIMVFPIALTQLKPYQLQRLQSFVNPNADPLGSGYHALQATIAVGSGKLIGRGLGQGTQSHLRFLPERHTDFIFASLVEELGLIGGILVIVSYLVLAISLLRAARYASSDLGSIIVLTSLCLILTQATVNLGMNMGIMPITGITLPFVSSGGSSILSLGLILGVCYSVTNRPSCKKPALEIGKSSR